VLTKSVGANHLDVELEEDEYLRVLHLLGIPFDGICKVSVTIIREGLTDETCYKNFTERGRHLLADLRSQDEFDFGPTRTES